MARRRRDSTPPPPDGRGGYEFEVVELGPPVYFGSPPVAKTRGGLTPVGDGDGLASRPAPPSTRRTGGSTKGLRLRTFTARFRDATADGIAQATVRGHELRYTHWESSGTDSGEDRSVVEVLVHVPAGTISVAVFPLHDLLGLFEGRRPQ